MVTKKVGLMGYDTLWFHPWGITNILFLSKVQKKHKVKYNSTLNQGFLVGGWF